MDKKPTKKYHPPIAFVDRTKDEGNVLSAEDVVLMNRLGQSEAEVAQQNKLAEEARKKRRAEYYETAEGTEIDLQKRLLDSGY